MHKPNREPISINKSWNILILCCIYTVLWLLCACSTKSSSHKLSHPIHTHWIQYVVIKWIWLYRTFRALCALSLIHFISIYSVSVYLCVSFIASLPFFKCQFQRFIQYMNGHIYTNAEKLFDIMMKKIIVEKKANWIHRM